MTSEEIISLFQTDVIFNYLDKVKITELAFSSQCQI
jgi:hypothetical protein